MMNNSNNVNLSTNVSGIQINNPFMNASGVWCTSRDELIELDNSSSSAVVTKSCTNEARQGNPKPRYYAIENEYFSINSMGIPNKGYEYYLDARTSIKKPYVLSVSGLSWKENANILEHAKNSGVDIVELNISCPNIIGKPQLGYDFEGFREITRKLVEIWDEPYKKPLGLKLPPYFDGIHFSEVSDIILDFQPTVRFLTCCNSFGNGLVVDALSESTVIRPKEGFGGIGGKFLKPTSLANVRKFYTAHDHKNVDIIGCAGISSGIDAFEYILCGAKAVQIGTELKQRGILLFDNVKNELTECMSSKGYQSLDDFRGKLKIVNESCYGF